MPALFVTFVVKLASLFGTRRDDITLERIPEIEQDASFSELWATGRKLYEYRSKLIAHQDINVGIQDFAKESGLTYDDLRKLLDDTCQLFDKYAEEIQVDGVDAFSCREDLERLLKHLAEHGGVWT